MGKVLWHLTLSLDGFIAQPDNRMDWLSGMDYREGVVDDYVATTGAILAGRRGFDAGASLESRARAAYGGKWIGPVFVLTHHPEDAEPEEGITFLNCDIAEAIEIGLKAADGKNVELFGADLGKQAVLAGLVDEFHVHLAPIMLGDGVRLFDCPGIEPVRWHLADQGPKVLDLVYVPATR